MSSSPRPPARGWGRGEGAAGEVPIGEDLGGSHADGATPLSPDEVDQLIPSYIVTRAELNEAEQDNIGRAMTSSKWRRKRQPAALLDDLVLHHLHRDMFSDVWGWAGTYRQSERNIGVDFWRIGGEMRNLVEDAKFWFARGSASSIDQALRGSITGSCRSTRSPTATAATRGQSPTCFFARQAPRPSRGAASTW